MGKGQAWKDPVFRYEDGRSGRVVTRLTDDLAHSNHLYCPDPRWLGGGGPFPFRPTRLHSLGAELSMGDGHSAFVGDARPFIQLFRREAGAGGAYAGLPVLAFHRSTVNDPHPRPHPRFTPDGRHVPYTSDLTGDSNLDLVEVGDWADLPPLT